MRTMRPLRRAKIGYMVISALFCLLGIVMLVWPGLSVSVIGVAAGILLIIFGVVKLMGYYSGDWFRRAFGHDFLVGPLMVILGILLLFNPSLMMGFLCMTLGIGIAADGLMKLQMAMKARRYGLRTWWLILLLGLLTAGIGAVTAFYPVHSAHLIMRLLGVCVLAEGAMNLVTVLCASKAIERNRPEIIETEFEDDF